MDRKSEDKVAILLVDDRDDGLLALEMVLASPEYNLVSASSGLEALSLLPLHDFAVILLDVQMPGIDGFETAKRIRDDAKFSHLPIIFVTAISKELHYIYSGYGSGAVDYLFKPIDTVVIRAKVSIFADLYRKNRKIQQQAQQLLENEKRSHLLTLAESQLENFRRYQHLADAVPHIIWKAKADGSPTYFNSCWTRYTGLDAEVCDDALWRSVFHQADIARLLDCWEAVKESCEECKTECRIRRHDGVYRWHLVQIVDEKTPEGKVSGWIGSCTDIHDGKEIQVELQRKAEELSHANKELTRSNKELEQFAYVASHDLQEPLRMVSNYVDLLAMHFEGRLDDEANNYIRHAYDGAIRAQELIRDILSYAKIGPKEQLLAKTDFERIFEIVLSNLKLVVAESGAQITQSGLPAIIADESQMVELLQHLISNAVKFRSVRPLTIHVSAHCEDKKWVFSVKDNGIGIELQYRQRIFGIFQRLHKKTEYPGTGIGLAICKKIVERHQGDIWVASDAGEGSTFCFSIPESLAQKIAPVPGSPSQNAVPSPALERGSA